MKIYFLLFVQNSFFSCILCRHCMLFLQIFIKNRIIVKIILKPNYIIKKYQSIRVLDNCAGPSFGRPSKCPKVNFPRHDDVPLSKVRYIAFFLLGSHNKQLKLQPDQFIKWKKNKLKKNSNRAAISHVIKFRSQLLIHSYIIFVYHPELLTNVVCFLITTIVNSDGFNRVETERSHRAPLKYIKKWHP